MKRIIAALFVAGVTTACPSAHFNVERLAEAPPRERGCRLDVFTDRERAPAHFQTLCKIDATQQARSMFTKADAELAIERAKPRACECGADAIVVVAERNGTFDDSSAHAKILAVRYTARP